MLSRVQKWGNSLGLRIPKSFAEEVQVRAGSTVQIHLEGGRLIVHPLRAPSYRLDELLAKVTRRNLHEEVSTGQAVGREVW
jgi:antitoxin MazE